MNKQRVARELIRISNSLVAGGMLNRLKDVAEKTKSFIDLGKELKSSKIKYSFSTDPVPFYTIKDGVSIFLICNKKYAEDAELVIGNIAIGKM